VVKLCFVLWCVASLYVLCPGLYMLGALLFVAAMLALRCDLQRHQPYEAVSTRPHSNWCAECHVLLVSYSLVVRLIDELTVTRIWLLLSVKS